MYWCRIEASYLQIVDRELSTQNNLFLLSSLRADEFLLIEFLLSLLDSYAEATGSYILVTRLYMLTILSWSSFSISYCPVIIERGVMTFVRQAGLCVTGTTPCRSMRCLFMSYNDEESSFLGHFEAMVQALGDMERK